jgi:hypothetical protein
VQPSHTTLELTFAGEHLGVGLPHHWKGEDFPQRQMSHHTSS